jgi:hypothetical protein
MRGSSLSKPACVSPSIRSCTSLGRQQELGYLGRSHGHSRSQQWGYSGPPLPAPSQEAGGQGWGQLED